MIRYIVLDDGEIKEEVIPAHSILDYTVMVTRKRLHASEQAQDGRELLQHREASMARIPIELPSPPNTVFSLATPHHMLIKFSWEIRQLKQSLETPSDNPFEVNVPAFIAFNCAVTGWHLADWTWSATDDFMQKKIADHFIFKLKSANRDNLSAFYDALSKDSRELHICRMIANGSKHMRLSRPDPSILAKVEWRPWEGINYTLTVLDKETPVAAQEVFTGAFEYWRRILSHFGFIEASFVGSD